MGGEPNQSQKNSQAHIEMMIALRKSGKLSADCKTASEP